MHRGRAAPVSEPPVRVLRLISGLHQGGAEESLRKLVMSTRQTGSDSLVVSFGRNGTLRAEIERAGARVVEMDLSRRPSPAKFFRMLKIVRDWKPDVIEGWMIHGNVLAYLLRWARPRARVVWNVRSSLHLAAERPLPRLLTRLGVFISYGVDAVVYNSGVAAVQHQRLGFSARRTRVIPNGFDTTQFAPSSGGRERARARWRLPENVQIIGHLSRWHPDKDHRTLLAAFAEVRRRRPSTRLVLAGAGLETDNVELMSAVDALQLRDAVDLLGTVNDSAALYPAFDAFVLTSIREGFPNVLGEAMASGVPCVATDVGGCREVVGDHAVFPVGDSAALADAMIALLDESSEAHARRVRDGRQHIVESFGLEAYGRRYLRLYDALLGRRPELVT